MFVPYIARRSINNQHYALNYITSLFNVQATTCFGISLPSSGRYTTFCSSNSHGSKKLPDDGRLLTKHVGACTLSKEVI
jgi:hypothetical protein